MFEELARGVVSPHGPETAGVALGYVRNADAMLGQPDLCFTISSRSVSQ